jgi:xylitol oxidase
MIEPRHNWAGNYTFNATRFHYPKTIEQVQELVSQAKKVRVLGSGHSFNGIADTSEDLISIQNLEQELAIDPERHTATVSGGVRYGQICEQLQAAGYALHNLASLPHITIAGACATATHGSGYKNGNLATAVAALELIRADGEIVVLSRDQNSDQFPGAVVGLGGLGVVTKVTLKLVPAFKMRQVVYENLPLDKMEAHFDEIMSSAYSVSLFTDWHDELIQQVWVKQRVAEGEESFELAPELFGATPATTPLHPIRNISPVACTPQQGITGPWYARLPHFRLDFTPSSGEELQSEYLIPRESALAALRIVVGLRQQIAPLLQVSEVRSIAADDLWMSPCYQQACIGLHFTWKKDWVAVRQLLPLLEEQLEPLKAIPHWGKLFTMPPARVQALYPKLADFRRLLSSFDPQGKFRNAFLDTYIFAE